MKKKLIIPILLMLLMIGVASATTVNLRSDSSTGVPFKGLDIETGTVANDGAAGQDFIFAGAYDTAVYNKIFTRGGTQAICDNCGFAGCGGDKTITTAGQVFAVIMADMTCVEFNVDAFTSGVGGLPPSEVGEVTLTYTYAAPPIQPTLDSIDSDIGWSILDNEMAYLTLSFNDPDNDIQLLNWYVDGNPVSPSGDYTFDASLYGEGSYSVWVEATTGTYGIISSPVYQMDVASSNTEPVVHDVCDLFGELPCWSVGTPLTIHKGTWYTFQALYDDFDGDNNFYWGDDVGNVFYDGPVGEYQDLIFDDTIYPVDGIPFNLYFILYNGGGGSDYADMSQEVTIDYPYCYGGQGGIDPTMWDDTYFFEDYCYYLDMWYYDLLSYGDTLGLRSAFVTYPPGSITDGSYIGRNNIVFDSQSSWIYVDSATYPYLDAPATIRFAFYDGTDVSNFVPYLDGVEAVEGVDYNNLVINTDNDYIEYDVLHWSNWSYGEAASVTCDTDSVLTGCEINDVLVIDDSYVSVNFGAVNGVVNPADIMWGTDYVYVDSASILNVPATIQFKSVPTPFTRILRDGVPCSDCSNIDYTAGVLTFDVTGFSNYTLENVSGSGTVGDPYQLTSCYELSLMNDNLTASYILVNDINCSETTTWNGGKGFLPIGYYENVTWTEYPFAGTFDGHNYTISNLFMDWQVGDGVYLGGLFGYTTYADIRNVVLENVNITCINEEWGSVGGFGGQNSETNFTHVGVTGYLEGSYTVGGISGELYGNINNSYAQVTIGINQLFSGPEIGGLVGYAGVVGAFNSTIVDSYAVMDYVDINLTDAQLYPLGRTQFLDITNSYFDCEVYGANCSDPEGKTTAELMSYTTTISWDYENVWDIDEGTSYPYFGTAPTPIEPFVLTHSVVAQRNPEPLLSPYASLGGSEDIWIFVGGSAVKGYIWNGTTIVEAQHIVDGIYGYTTLYGIMSFTGWYDGENNTGNAHIATCDENRCYSYSFNYTSGDWYRDAAWDFPDVGTRLKTEVFWQDGILFAWIGEQQGQSVTNLYEWSGSAWVSNTPYKAGLPQALYTYPSGYYDYATNKHVLFFGYNNAGLSSLIWNGTQWVYETDYDEPNVADVQWDNAGGFLNYNTGEQILVQGGLSTTLNFYNKSVPTDELLDACNDSSGYSYCSVPYGNGSQYNPYMISSEEHMLWYQTNHNTNYAYDYVILIGDINMTGSTYSSFSFNGSFDGQGFTIYGLEQALFSNAHGIVKNVVIDANASLGGNSGMISGVVNGGTLSIENVDVGGQINLLGSLDAGGLIGGVTNGAEINFTNIDVTLNMLGAGGNNGLLVGYVQDLGTTINIDGLSVTGSMVSSGGYDISMVVGLMSGASTLNMENVYVEPDIANVIVGGILVGSSTNVVTATNVTIRDGNVDSGFGAIFGSTAIVNAQELLIYNVTTPSPIHTIVYNNAASITLTDVVIQSPLGGELISLNDAVITCDGVYVDGEENYTYTRTCDSGSLIELTGDDRYRQANYGLLDFVSTWSMNEGRDMPVFNQFFVPGLDFCDATFSNAPCYLFEQVDRSYYGILGESQYSSYGNLGNVETTYCFDFMMGESCGYNIGQSGTKTNINDGNTGTYMQYTGFPYADVRGQAFYNITDTQITVSDTDAVLNIWYTPYEVFGPDQAGFRVYCYDGSVWQSGINKQSESATNTLTNFQAALPSSCLTEFANNDELQLRINFYFSGIFDPRLRIHELNVQYGIPEIDYTANVTFPYVNGDIQASDFDIGVDYVTVQSGSALDVPAHIEFNILDDSYVPYKDGEECLTCTNLVKTPGHMAFDVSGWSTYSYGNETPKFISTWRTTTANESITLPLESSGSYNFTVLWGDNTTDNITVYNQAEVTHTYTDAGYYNVTIIGEIDGFRFNNGGSRNKIYDILQWGQLKLGNNGNYFYGCSNLDVTASDTPDLSDTTTLSRMFLFAYKMAGTEAFGDWDVSTITDMDRMFHSTLFNQNISSWDVSHVTDFEAMFYDDTSPYGTFNYDIGGWNTSSATTMSYMFYGQEDFNQDISSWDVSGVTDMSYMFVRASSFNQDIGSWDTSSLNNMLHMFERASSFNQDIGSWDVSGVSTFTYVFYLASSFDQNLSSWDISNAALLFGSFENFGIGTNFSVENYGALLEGWSTQAPNTGLTLQMGTAQYPCSAVDARSVLTTNYSWTISDGGPNEFCNPFRSLWRTTSPSESITLPLISGGSYNFTVDWGDNSSDIITSYNQAEITHTYTNAGYYNVTIGGEIEGFRFNNGGSKDKIYDIMQWGTLAINNDYAFYGCVNLNVTATDAPTFTSNNIRGMFWDATNFNGAVDHWNMNGLQDVRYLFMFTNFNQPVNSWDTSTFTEIDNMFYNTPFNQPVDNWDTSSVQTMRQVFSYATDFNQDLDAWDTSNVQVWQSMFQGASSFNGNVSTWDVTGANNPGDMQEMFAESNFSGDVSNWNVSNVYSFESLFRNTPFNGDLSSWEFDNAYTMARMFQGADSFNQDISSWDVSNVQRMDYMFAFNDAFDQNIGSWDTGNVFNMDYMFRASVFDQDISGWDMTSVTSANGMFQDVTLSTSNYDNMLIGWAAQSVQTGVTFNAGSSTQYSCIAVGAHDTLTDTYSWTITDGGANETCAIPLCDADLTQWRYNGECLINNTAFVLNAGIYNLTDKHILLNGTVSFDGNGATIYYENTGSYSRASNALFLTYINTTGNLDIGNFTAYETGVGEVGTLIDDQWGEGFGGYNSIIHDIDYTSVGSSMFDGYDIDSSHDITIYNVNADCTENICFTVYIYNDVTITDSNVSEIGYVNSVSGDVIVDNVDASGAYYYGGVFRAQDGSTATLSVTNSNFALHPTFGYANVLGLYAYNFDDVSIENNTVEGYFYVRGYAGNGSAILRNNELSINTNYTSLDRNVLRIFNIDAELYDNTFDTENITLEDFNILSSGNVFSIAAEATNGVINSIGDDNLLLTTDSTSIVVDYGAADYNEAGISDVSFGNDWVSVDSASYYDQPARITFYGDIAYNDIPYKDGTPCGASCTDVTLVEGTSLSFNVSGFSNYTYAATLIPEVISIDLQPIVVAPQNQIVGSCIPYDEQDGSLDVYYRFYKNGEIYESDVDTVSSEEELSVSLGATLTIGDVWQFACNVVDDQAHESGWSYSVNRTVVPNSAPVPVVTITTPVYDNNDNLPVYCSATDINEDDSGTYTWRLFREDLLYDQGTVVAAIDGTNKLMTTVTNESELIEGEEWYAQCKVDDGIDESTYANSSTITVQRDSRPPTLDYVRLYPIIIFNDSTLSAQAYGRDVNGDVLTFDYTLYKNNVSVETAQQNITPGLSSVVFTYSNIAIGDEIKVGVVVQDIDYILLEQFSYTFTVRANNTAPEIDNVRLNPAAFIGVDDNIQGYCTASDIDGDTVNFNYVWYVNNVSVKSGNKVYSSYLGYTQGNEILVDTLSSSYTLEGDNVYFTCQAYDSEDAGSYASSSTQYIFGENNYAPELKQARVDPISGDTFQDLDLYVKVKDKDEGAVFMVEWRIVKNGVYQPLQTTEYFTYLSGNNEREILVGEITSAQTEAGDVFYIRARAYDGFDYSGWASSNAVTISNTPPTMTAADIITPPLENNTLVSDCTASDVDDQDVTFDKIWYRNGAYNFTGENLPSTYTQAGESWILSCRAYDGVAYSDWLNSTNVTIIDTSTLPVIANMSISGQGNTLVGTCLATDIEGDTLNYSMQFYKGGALQTSVSYTNQPQGVEQSINYTGTVTAGDEWTLYCMVTDIDGSVDDTEVLVIPSITFLPVVSSKTVTTITIDWTTNADGVMVWLDDVYLGETTLPRYIFEDLDPETEYNIKLQAVKDGFFSAIHEFNETTEETDNNLPVIFNVTISPTTAYTDTVLTGKCGADDIESPLLFYTYDWYVNNVSIDSGVSSLKDRGTLATIDSLTSSHYVSGDTVQFGCVANDGLQSSNETRSDILTILNTPQEIDEDFISISETETDFNCTYEFYDIDGDNETGVSYEWFLNGVAQGANASTIPIDGIGSNDELVCQISSSTAYHTVVSNSSTFVVGDYEDPIISDLQLPETVYTDESYLISTVCSDNVAVAQGYPKITMLNPNLLEREYPFFYDEGDSFSRYLTFPVAGTYSEIEIVCKDGNGNMKILHYDGTIEALVRETVINIGGGGSSSSGGGEDINITVFTLNPVEQFFDLFRSQTRIVEFEIINELAEDVSFTMAILVNDEYPEVYEWMEFENGLKAITFDIQEKGSLSTGSKFIRYYLDIPADVDPGTYVGIIEVNGKEQTKQYKVNIEVAEGNQLNLLGILNYELFEIPFTATPTGAVVEGIQETIGKPFKVWMLLLFIGGIVVLIITIRALRK